MDTGNTSRWALYWRNKCGRSLEQVREELKSSVQEDSYAQAKEVLKGDKMHDTEVNKRAREVEHELCEMRKQWVNMYDLISRLIEDTTIEIEEDTRIDYNKCINCEHHDTDKNGITCMIMGNCIK